VPYVVAEVMTASRLAVIRHSGFWSASNGDKHLGQLTGARQAARLGWAGAPVYPRNNAPSTPWFLRRHEIRLGLR
jgi:hypothetical protein